jgi:hypothetical protein
MRKVSIMVAALFLLASAPAFAQTSDTTEKPISACVGAPQRRAGMPRSGYLDWPLGSPRQEGAK